jgi:hypothetical protein
MSHVHYLKSVDPWYEPIEEGNKRHDIRVNDRDYKEGDTVVLLHYYAEVDAYTGKYEMFKIGYISKNPTQVKEGYVVFTLLEFNRSNIDEDVELGYLIRDVNEYLKTKPQVLI